MSGVGRVFPATIRMPRTRLSPPSESVTVRLALYEPAEYWLVTTGPLPPVPSPKSHPKVRGRPSGSKEADASNVTVSGDSPLSGVAVTVATG